uniref:Uncharacterized protein n=1 Tax=Plectus sambesii TaxID=2011161 RepID=A0A914VX55_9BILA
MSNHFFLLTISSLCLQLCCDPALARPQWQSTIADVQRSIDAARDDMECFRTVGESCQDAELGLTGQCPCDLGLQCVYNVCVPVYTNNEPSNVEGEYLSVRENRTSSSACPTMYGRLIEVAFVALSCAQIVLSQDAAAAAVAPEQKTDVKEQEMAELFCQQYNHLNLCKLRETLEGALVEIQYLLEGDDNASESPLGTSMEKRKSAFVRFGKRKSAFVRFGKRKSAFVRFGRSLEEAENKRKSSYIRFG